MSKNILFSIIIPVFNSVKSIKKTLDSVLNQSFLDFEIIVIDDGSMDQTRDAVIGINSSFIKYFYQSNFGVSKARNCGVEKSKGKYLIFLDSDDEVTSNWLMDFYISIINNSSDIIFCGTKVIYPNLKEKYINPRYPYKVKDESGFFIAGSFCIKKDIFILIGGYDEKLKYGENTELGFRLKKIKTKIDFIEHLNFIYHSSISGGSKNWSNKLYSIIHILNKHRQMFNENIRLFSIYLNVAGVSAYHCKKYKLSKKLLFKSISIDYLFYQAWLRLFYISIYSIFYKVK